jgi:hypothetical protein
VQGEQRVMVANVPLRTEDWQPWCATGSKPLIPMASKTKLTGLKLREVLGMKLFGADSIWRCGFSCFGMDFNPPGNEVVGVGQQRSRNGEIRPSQATPKRVYDMKWKRVSEGKKSEETLMPKRKMVRERMK